MIYILNNVQFFIKADAETGWYQVIHSGRHLCSITEETLNLLFK